ncbi:MAG TPA: GNAT family N-acetyltransferase [Candidatus Limnocylindria bacterium]|nr:GNAT family N-acetyltransferase [Candidatus Limnocylindria bacterium]
MPGYPFPTDPDEVLLTERLRLEPIVAAHAPLLFDLWQDPAVFRYVPQDPPESLAWLSERYRKLETRQPPEGDEAWLQWAVRFSAEPTYVGVVEATVVPHGASPVAWMFGSAWWRQGLASEAMTRVLAQLADAWGVADVYVEIDERNVPSLALAHRLGFEEFARVEDADHFKGETSHERHLRRQLAPSDVVGPAGAGSGVASGGG